MFSIAEQLAALKPALTGKDKTKQDNAEDRARQMYDVLSSIGNAQVSHLVKQTGYHHDTVKTYLKTLKAERKIVSWRVGNATWYGVLNPPKRRK